LTMCATGLPGVLFVLPDSYVDPEYKDYGGSFLLLHPDMVFRLESQLALVSGRSVLNLV